MWTLFPIWSSIAGNTCSILGKRLRVREADKFVWFDRYNFWIGIIYSSNLGVLMAWWVYCSKCYQVYGRLCASWVFKHLINCKCWWEKLLWLCRYWGTLKPHIKQHFWQSITWKLPKSWVFIRYKKYCSNKQSFLSESSVGCALLYLAFLYDLNFPNL